MIRMPLKLKLGKSSGRYELSEDIYILTIFLGENAMAQCTLTSQSTSADVFRYLAEKFQLSQSEIFGLQYQMKATDTEKRMRWIEPDKPIRRQLERWACRREKKWAVNLAILHACSNVFTLHDAYSRFVYYTLLKLDVLQGEKFALDLDKCINLAAYQLQIEFPDFKPTLQQLKMLNLLPTSMCRNPKINTDDTYLRILTAFEKLHTMEPAYASLLYIVDVQQCVGYGEEAFTCKDGTSFEEVSLGYCLDWIFVRRQSGNTQKFRWEEVREIAPQKRKLLIKYRETLATAVFCFEDNEMARYVATVLGWKHRHSRTDAQQQRSARLSMQNLQGGVPPAFSQPGSFLRRSNTNMNAIRPSSELNGSSNGFGPFLPSTPQLGGMRDQQQGSSSQSTVHSVQSCAIRGPPANSSLSVCCRSISLSQQVPSSVAAAFLRPPAAEKTSPPSVAFYPPGMLTPGPSTPLATHPPAQLQQQTSNSSQDSDWLRNEQREVLKRMLTEKRRLNKASKMGSSPEINNLGKTGTKLLKQRQQLNGGGQANMGAFSLARKIFTSTPNLHSARRPGQQQTPPPSQPAPAHNGNGNGFVTSADEPMLLPPFLPSPQLAGRRLLLGQPMALQFPPTYHHSAAAAAAGNDAGGNFFLVQQQQNGAAIPSAAQKAAANPIGGSQPSNAFFSQGQIIDENGQQRTIFYPTPPPPPPPPPPAQSPPPPAFPSNSPPVLLEENNRSSPKSAGTSLHSNEHCGIQPATVNNGSTADQQPKVLPEFAEIEFSGVPAKSLSADFSVAVRPHNLHRNRGSKIYPYNENRVRLLSTKSNPDGYINASELAVPLGQRSRLRYVISQAPIQKTIEDFWQMIWETGAQLIVMLVNPHQINKDDTIPSYIPSQAKEKLTVGDFFLRLKNVSPPQMQPQFQSTTTFTLAKQGQPRRTIFHLYCADFSEQGVPSSMDTFIGLIDAVASVRRHIHNEAKRNAEKKTAAVAKSNSNTSKESNSDECSNRNRAESAAENGGGGWTKRLRFDQNSKSSAPAQQGSKNGGGSSVSGSTAAEKTAKPPAADSKQQQAEEEPLSIIQCTDGASESGLYLLAEVIIRCMEKNTPFEMAQLLRDLRYQRMCLVKNAKQYKFVYDLVTFYERKNRLV